MYLYIDANVYLNFYGFTKGALEELAKLLKLVQSGKVILLLPSQTKDEVNRRRENKIKDIIGEISDSKLRIKFPAVMGHYDEIPKLKSTAAKYNATFIEMMVKFKHDVTNRTLRADELIDMLHDSSTQLPSTKKLLRLASGRKIIGNPPGKGSTHGDQINWECLLDFKFKYGTTFSIVTDDTDYYSSLYSHDIDKFLQDEFVNIHSSINLVGYKLLSQFTKANYPNIQFDDNFLKSFVLSDLKNSSSYYDAKYYLRKLENMQPFSVE